MWLSQNCCQVSVYIHFTFTDMFKCLLYFNFEFMLLCLAHIGFASKTWNHFIICLQLFFLGSYSTQIIKLYFDDIGDMKLNFYQEWVTQLSELKGWLKTTLLCEPASVINYTRTGSSIKNDKNKSNKFDLIMWTDTKQKWEPIAPSIIDH